MFVGHIGAGAGSFVTASQSGNSLRFKREQGTYLKRYFDTGTTPTSTKVRVYFFSLKRTEYASGGCLYFSDPVNNTEQFSIYFSNVTYELVIRFGDKTQNGEIRTPFLFKDTSDWINLTIAIDTSQATSSNRVFIYFNNVKLTKIGTATLNLDLGDLGTGTKTTYNYIGSNQWTGPIDPDKNFLDCYLSKVYIVDGYPTGVDSTNWSTFDFSSLFIQLNTDNGKYVPKDYTGTFGTCGIKLVFADGTSLSKLGKDSSGNNKHYTPYNFSITEGWTNDWLLDNPVSNFALLNVHKSKGSGTLNKACVELVPSGECFVFSTLPTQNDKEYYFEVEVTSSNSSLTAGPSIGLSEDSNYVTTNDVFESTLFDSICYRSNGQIYQNGALVTTVATYGKGYTIGVYRYGTTVKFYALDTNNVWSEVYSGTLYLNMEYFPVVGFRTGGTNYSVNTLRVNFGQRAFKRFPDLGQHLKGIYEGNFPLPTITNPKNHFDIVLRSGTGAAATVSSLAFSPGLIWTKNRTSAKSNSLTDKVRGTSSQLVTNTTAIQTTLSTAITAINSNGYSLGTDTVINQVSTTLVDWIFAAGSGTPVTNNDGTKTSTVSANPAAGFSIVKYVGQTSGTFTVGHGLGSVPDLVIGKRIDGGTGNWVAYFRKNNWAAMMYLNTTAGIVTALNTIGMSGDTAISINTTVLNGAASNYLLYCFKEIPGYSKIGKYLGSGGSMYVYCGFKPRFILIKSIGTGDWSIYDTSRIGTTITPIDSVLYANQAVIEATVSGIDIMSHGFKVISTNADLNTSDVLYYFMAIA